MASNTAENSRLSPGLTLAVTYITGTANLGSFRRRSALRRGLTSPLWTLISKTMGEFHLSEDDPLARNDCAWVLSPRIEIISKIWVRSGRLQP
jgi:hypothetical protein